MSARPQLATRSPARLGRTRSKTRKRKSWGLLTRHPPTPCNLWIPVIGFNARYLKGAVCVAEEWPLKAAEFKSGAPRSSMRLRQITVAPTFAANQRHRLLSGRLPLTEPCVISRVPPACATIISPKDLVALDLPSSPMLGAALAHELETSAIPLATQISDRMVGDVSARSPGGSCSEGSLR